MMRKSLIIALLAAISFTAGCPDEVIIARGGGPPGADSNFPTSDADPDAADLGEFGDGLVDKDTGGPVEPGDRELIVLHDLSEPLGLYVEQQMLIRAKVIDYGLSGPAPGALVTYTIIDNPQGGNANFTSQQVLTDNKGQVSVTFRANQTGNATYTIRIATADAAPVDFSIIVSEPPSGSIRVKLAYEGPINVKNVHLRLFPGTYTCGQFNATNVPTQVVGDKIIPGLGTNSDAVFDDLLASQKFTAVATAESPTGSLAAAGCIDGIVVLPDAENAVTLTMFLLTLNPAGTYDTVNIFDFTDAIPGQLGDLVDQIVLLFNDPGKFLIDQVKNLVATYIGSLATDIVFGFFEDQLASIITDWMLNSSPDWIQDIFTIGQDLTQVVNHLQMEAILKISKLSNDYYVQGVLYWTGIVLYWHYGCAEEGEAGYDPECGKYTFSLQDFTDTAFPLNIVEGKFTGFIQNFDYLDIDNHVIKINYGKLIIFVLNELILPALTGEHNLTDAIISFINCKSIGNGFVGDVLSLLGITSDDVAGFCIDGITLIVKPIELVIGGLALDSQLRMSGSAKLIDDNNDLIVDRIVDGVYLGHIEVDGAEGPAFDGTWSAVRETPIGL